MTGVGKLCPAHRTWPAKAVWPAGCHLPRALPASSTHQLVVRSGRGPGTAAPGPAWQHGGSGEVCPHQSWGQWSGPLANLCIMRSTVAGKEWGKNWWPHNLSPLCYLEQGREWGTLCSFLESNGLEAVLSPLLVLTCPAPMTSQGTIFQSYVWLWNLREQSDTDLTALFLGPGGPLASQHISIFS